MCTTLCELRLNLFLVDEKLNSMPGVDKTAKARIVFLTLSKPSKKYKWAANAPFPAIVKEAAGGLLSVFNCVTGKKELVELVSTRQNEIIGDFDHKGHCYIVKDTLNDVPRYVLAK